MPKQKVRPTLSTYNDAGQEICDPDPLSIPVKFRRPMSVAEEVAKLMRNPEFRRRLDDLGLESFDEADDFNIPDDPIDPLTPYEDGFEPGADGMAARLDEIKHGIVSDVKPEDRIKARKVIDERKRSNRSDNRATDKSRRSARRDVGSKATDRSRDEVDEGDTGSEDLEKE